MRGPIQLASMYSISSYSHSRDWGDDVSCHQAFKASLDHVTGESAHGIGTIGIDNKRGWIMLSPAYVLGKCSIKDKHPQYAPQHHVVSHCNHSWTRTNGASN
jgi:hypothetical protein